MADWNGNYKISYQPDMEGTWTVKPWGYGDVYNNATNGTPLTFTVSTATQPSPALTQPSTTIISGIPDIYLYIGIFVIAIIILAIAAILIKPKHK